MTTAQKIIKYLAISFAIFLIITIISTVLFGIYALSGALGLRNDDTEILEDLSTITFANQNVKELEIDITYTNLTIKNGDIFKVETDNNNLGYKESNNNLKIEEKNNNFLFNNKEGNVILYIPENIEFEKVKINTGAGKIYIENLNAEKLEFDIGAGETEIEKLNVTRECDIDGGAGKLSILSGTISNLDLDMGIGEVNLTSTLNKESEINAGIGNLNITLQGDKESYKIKTHKGLGTIRIDSTDMQDNQTLGSGENYIKIEGGIGNIKVDFE